MGWDISTSWLLSFNKANNLCQQILKNRKLPGGNNFGTRSKAGICRIVARSPSISLKISCKNGFLQSQLDSRYFVWREFETEGTSNKITSRSKTWRCKEFRTVFCRFRRLFAIACTIFFYKFVNLVNILYIILLCQARKKQFCCLNDPPVLHLMFTITLCYLN